MQHKPVELWAVVSEEPNGEENIVDLFTKLTGHMPCVSTKRGIVLACFDHIHPDVKKRSRIIRLVEVIE